MARALTKLEMFGSFNSRTPARGATEVAGAHLHEGGVSIHAPREGCDSERSLERLASVWFQFTHPVRGATVLARFLARSCEFQFTHPVRGAISFSAWLFRRFVVSIHAPREGCDPS